MLINLNTFISDFKTSGLVEQLCATHDVIFIWVTGSHAMGLADHNSDYDLGILVADDIKISTTEKNPITYLYKKNGKEVQCIYNTVSDIYAPHSSDFLAVYQYLCWCVFRTIQNEHIIYINPKYREFLNVLIANKNEISVNAFYSFTSFLKDSICAVKCKDDIKKIAWGKMLTYLCWYADILQGVESNSDTLVKVKRLHRTAYTEIELQYIFECLVYIQTYLETIELPKLPLFQNALGGNY